MMNGQHAVFIGVNATPTGNPLTIVKGVRELLPTIERGLPPTVKMNIVYDSTNFIHSSINEVIRTLVEAVAIVIVVIFLFLGTFRSVRDSGRHHPAVADRRRRSSCWRSGFSLNLLTLLAMVLAIGLVVDDAIVVVENIYRHIEEGMTPIQAALIGAREIVGPVIAMTITLAAVYAPIGFLGGLTGALFREFAFTLAGAVIISGIVALTLSPMMCSMLLTARDVARAGSPAWSTASSRRVTRWYGRRLTPSLDYRPVTALFAVVVLASLVFLFTHTSSELAPDEDQGVLFAHRQGRRNTPTSTTPTSTASSSTRSIAPSRRPTRDLHRQRLSTGLNSSISGMILKPWDERKRSVAAAPAAGAGASSTRSPGCRSSPSTCRRCPAPPAACRCRW